MKVAEAVFGRSFFFISLTGDGGTPTGATTSDFTCPPELGITFTPLDTVAYKRTMKINYTIHVTTDCIKPMLQFQTSKDF